MRISRSTGGRRVTNRLTDATMCNALIVNTLECVDEKKVNLTPCQVYVESNNKFENNKLNTMYVKVFLSVIVY